MLVSAVNVVKMSTFRLVVMSICAFSLLSENLITLAQDNSELEASELDGVRGDAEDKGLFKPTVMIAVLIRNKAHVLPWFFYYLENLDYPKDRIKLWIRSDHNFDESVSITRQWLNRVGSSYHHVDFQTDDREIEYSDQEGPCHWSKLRFSNVIRLRQESLDAARDQWVDYLLSLDADSFLLNNQTLNKLIAQNKIVIAPMLNVTANSYYSNYWCGMDERGYYQRTPDYIPILNRYVEGCHAVAMVHSAFLLSLRHKESQHLSYNPPPFDYKGPLDDIIIFAFSAKFAGINMYLLNDDFYGLMLTPMESQNTVEQENDQFVHLRIETLVYEIPFKKLDYLDTPERLKVKSADTLGFDKIFMINLERRPERRDKMAKIFEELGINSQVINAVDGKTLNDTYLKSLGVEMLNGYADPHHKRPLTMGEIGCFLSHYRIWENVLKNGYRKVIVFEDDVRFEPYFRQKMELLMHEVDYLQLEWDLIYLGRKRLNKEDESWLEGSQYLVHPSYSYWTLGYMLSQGGAQKLLNQQPLQKMIPVDEYLPIMFDKHPEARWKEAFQPRNLLGLSAEPLLIYPTHYTGEKDYISDTEDSTVLPEDEAPESVHLPDEL